MRFFYFTEQPYPDAWDKDDESVLITLPSHHYDARHGADLLNRYLDEYALADELGFDIMVNEHHSSSTCLSVSGTVSLAMLARETKRAKLLLLGVPIANRRDPVRVAEEIAYIDCVSRGRVEVGLVKGSPFELAPANANPTTMMERFWEAHDLFLKALTTTDGPFSFEGRFYHERHVNIWPTPYQKPHPPIWVTAQSPQTGRIFAPHGYVATTVLSGFNAKLMIDAYRRRRDELDLATTADHFGYMALLGVGRTRAEGLARFNRVKAVLDTAGKVAPQFKNPPGYVPIAANAAALRDGNINARLGAHFTIKLPDGRAVDATTASAEDFIAAGVGFAGTPDDVYRQIVDFNAQVGGVGNIILMAQGGSSSFADTQANLSLFAKEVMPRLADLASDQEIITATRR